MTLDVTVEVHEPATAVLVRGLGLVDELAPVALVDNGDGTWGGTVEVPVVDNFLMGFEMIPLTGPSVLSEFHPLTEYGVDPAVFEGTATPLPVVISEDSEGTTAWGWLIVAAAAGILAIALLWVWARPSRAPIESDTSESGSEPGQSSEPSADATSDPEGE